MTPKRFTLALLCVALAWPTAANAGLVTWELEGTIEQVAPYMMLDGYVSNSPWAITSQLEAVEITVGAYWRARVIFDPDSAAEPCPECGVGYTEFNGSIRWMEFVAGAFAATTPEGTVGDALILPFSSGQVDGIGLVFFTPIGHGSDALVADSARLVLVPIVASLFPATSLPTEAPEPSALVAPTAGLYGTLLGTHLRLLGHGYVPSVSFSEAQSFAIDGRITSITAVTEPSLFSLGLVAASAASALRRRSRALP